MRIPNIFNIHSQTENNRKIKQSPYFSQPCDTFTRSVSTTFEGREDENENKLFKEFTNKTKELKLPLDYFIMKDYVTYHEQDKKTGKTKLKLYAPALDLIAGLYDKAINSTARDTILYTVQYRSKEDGYVKFDDFAVKHCLEGIENENNTPVLAMQKIITRLNNCKGEDGKVIPETFNTFNDVLEKSGEWDATVDYMNLITDSNNAIIPYKKEQAETLLKKGITYDLIRKALPICLDSSGKISDNNTQKYINFTESRISSNSLINMLNNNCKDLFGEITQEAYDVLCEISERFKLSRLPCKIAEYCIGDGEIDEKMYKSLTKLADKIENQVEKEHALDDGLMLLSCLQSANLSSSTINGFLKFADKENLPLKNYRNALILCMGNDGKFSGKDLYNIQNLINTAIERRDILKNGDVDLTDSDIKDFFWDNAGNVCNTVELMGIKNFIYSFVNKMDYLENMVEHFGDIRLNIRDDQYEKILQKTNPEESHYYKTKTKELKKLKAELNSEKSADFKKYESIINNGINTLTDKISEIKQTSCDKDAINELNKRIKQLKFILKQNKTPEVLKLEEKIRQTGSKIRSLLNSAIKDPQEAIKLLNIISAFSKDKNSDPNAIEEVTMMFPADTPEKKEKLNRYLSEKILGLAGIEYDEDAAKKLNLTKSKYLTEIFSARSDFMEEFTKLLYLLIAEPDKTVAEIFNELPQNIETRKMFEKRGIDYDKWVNADKNSYVKVQIQTDLEASRQAAIRNLETDLNDELWKNIPDEEAKKIFDAVKEAGYELKQVQEVIYDSDGYEDGTKEVQRLFKNEKRIEYKDLEQLIKIIKKTINENEFWTKTYEISAIDNARATLHNHLTKLRENEIKNTSKLKSDTVSNLEVHKTDMNNLAHSLFLGNQSHCCTAIGGGANEHSAVTYAMNKMVSAIEVMDGNEFVGNTMCYIAQVDGKLSLLLDNIELAPKYQFNDKIRDAIFKYAEKMCAEIGKPDMPIYAGPNRHKVNMPEDTLEERPVTLVGTTGEDAIYLDFDTDIRTIGGNDLLDELDAYVNGGIYTEKENTFSVKTFKIR